MLERNHEAPETTREQYENAYALVREMSANCKNEDDLIESHKYAESLLLGAGYDKRPVLCAIRSFIAKSHDDSIVANVMQLAATKDMGIIPGIIRLTYMHAGILSNLGPQEPVDLDEIPF